MVIQRRYAPSRQSSIHSGSPFLFEMKRTISSLRPLAAVSDSMSVVKPYLYLSTSMPLTSSIVSRSDMVVLYAAMRARRRALIVFETAIKRSTSSSVVFQPRLTRMAPLTISGARPMAASTCDLATLPEEQAEPEEIAIPSRSNAMSNVSASTPGQHKHVVFGSRSTDDP